MIIRAYTAEDDAALMELERQCPRGAPAPFVHYRRRFVDRAALFREHYLLVLETHGSIVGVVAAGIKETRVQGQPLRLGYIFDMRIAPSMRRQGLAAVLLESLEADLMKMGCDGAYAHIVATNVGSLRLFGTLGYERRRQLRYLTYQPMPLFLGEPAPVDRSCTFCYDRIVDSYGDYDLFVNDVAHSVVEYDFEQWQLQGGEALIHLYDQSQLFQQTPADAPWPTPEEIARRGRHWRLFHPIGPEQELQLLFEAIRDEAVSQNIDKLTMLADAQAPIPSFFYAETSDQREYVVVTHPFNSRWDGILGARIYCDTREL